MKIHILYLVKQGPFGGGNQFLKALRNEFEKRGVYEPIPEKADVILYNSHHFLKQILKLKKKFPNKIFIHRVDGPIFKIRKNDIEIDEIIYFFNNLIADGTIFQSEWSRHANYSQGMGKNNFETVVINAPDSNIFNNENKSFFRNDSKIRLIATSWSANWSKGFDVYKYLDENLDFDKYEMSFIGNAPIQFNNIKQINPLPSNELAGIIKKHDIFITASKNDPCSNSLIEALHCDLPAVVYHDGGHPEIIRNGGEVFNKKTEVIDKIKKISDNYHLYQNNIDMPKIELIAEKYYDFAFKIFEKNTTNQYQIKEIKKAQYYALLIKLISLKVRNKLKNLLHITN